MLPVKEHTMINFIEWVDKTHPEIRSLRNLGKKLLLSLVNEFEGGKLNGNEELKTKWIASFEYYLSEKNSNKETMEMLNEFEIRKGNRTYKGDLRELGILGRDQDTKDDYLGRRKLVPLQAIFLFTSEDRILENYIIQNYDALYSLSGDYCDIYISIDQLYHNENAYDHLKEVEIIKKAKDINITNLPGIVFWDKTGEYVYISLEMESSESEITKRLRIVFNEIRKNPRLDSIKNLNSKFNQTFIGSVQKILFASANPKNTSPIRVDEEVREIEDSLRQSMNRNKFEFRQTHATRISDFRRVVLDFSPHIIHFSGHGDEEGILLEDEIGNYQIITSSSLENFFKLFKDQIKCVVLNSCYSKNQAQAIVNHIPYVIGMNDAILDDAAIKFSTAFYDALGAGRDIEFAFNLGINNIELEGVRGNNIPELLKN